jgi:hypothetical protein
MTRDFQHMKRWLFEQPPEYPEAVVKLIDAIRDYLRSNQQIGNDLFQEGSITKLQFDEGMEADAPLVAWLKQHEEWNVDPSLHGLIKEKH